MPADNSRGKQRCRGEAVRKDVTMKYIRNEVASTKDIFNNNVE